MDESYPKAKDHPKLPHNRIENNEPPPNRGDPGRGPLAPEPSPNSGREDLKMESIGNRLSPVVRNIMTSGMEGKYDIETMHKVLLLNFISITAVIFLVPLGIVAFVQGNSTLGLFDHFTVLIVISNFFYLRRSENCPFACIIGIAIIIILYAYLLATGGVNNTAQLWYYTFPLGASFLLGSKNGAIATSTLLIFAIIFFAVDFDSPYLTHYSKAFIIRFIPSFIVVFIFSYAFEYFRETTAVKLISKNDELNRTIKVLKDTEKQYLSAYETLKETQAQLVQAGKLAAIGQLAAGVAHELNQPLMVARTNAQLALRGLDKQALSHEDMRDRIQSIEKSTKRMMNIINHLRTFSRQSQKELSPVDVNGVVKDCFLMIGEQLRVYDVDLKLELAVHLPKIMGNANQLEQVFLNVITNARDAVLEVRTTENRTGVIEVVTGMFGKQPEWVEVMVTDTGKGIPSKYLDRIFEPFFTTKEIGKGTGLGLSISYGIIKEHQGEIEVLETGPGGTTFKISLPIRV